MAMDHHSSLWGYFKPMKRRNFMRLLTGGAACAVLLIPKAVDVIYLPFTTQAAARESARASLTWNMEYTWEDNTGKRWRFERGRSMT